MNQWQKLVQIIESDKEKRKEIAQALGYNSPKGAPVFGNTENNSPKGAPDSEYRIKDISKGINKLITHIRNKTLATDMLKIIAPLLGLDIEEVIADYQETKRIIKREQKLLNQIAYLNTLIYQRDTFKPYIFIETSLRIPTFITGAAFFGGEMKYIRNLPEHILELSKPGQLRLIGKIILIHYEEEKGKCVFFGDITSYIYYPEINQGIKFSTSGDLLEEHIPTIIQPECGIYYKGRKISFNINTV